MADKVGMSLDQIIKLNRISRGGTKGRGSRGRGNTPGRNENVGRGGKLRGASQQRGRGRGNFAGRGRAGLSAGRGRGRIGRGGIVRNTTSVRQNFSPSNDRRPVNIKDAREKLKSKVDAREKLKAKAARLAAAKRRLAQNQSPVRKAQNIVDARNKIKTNAKTRADVQIHQDIRKEHRSNAFLERRKFAFTDTGIKITTKQDEREAEVMDNSIKITAKAAIPSSSSSSSRPSTTAPQGTNLRTALMGGSMVRILTDNKPRSLPSLPKMQTTDRAARRPRSVDLLEERLGDIEVPVRSQVETTSGTRVIITNLHNQVSQADIEELFGVIGDLRNAKMLGEGVAEVIYSKREDAVAAFQKYHNRNLDGLPMQCRLSSLPTQSLYSPPTPTLRSDNMNVSGGKPGCFQSQDLIQAGACKVPRPNM